MNHRSSLITAAAVATVLVAASAALAVNLSASAGSTSSSFGVFEPTQPATTSVVVDTPSAPPATLVVVPDLAPAPTVSVDPEPASPQVVPPEMFAFALSDAGVITLSSQIGTLPASIPQPDRPLLTIASISLDPAWQVTRAVDGTSVEVEVTSSSGTVLQFLAAYNVDGSVITSLNDVTPVLAARAGNDDDRYDDDRYEDDDD